MAGSHLLIDVSWLVIDDSYCGQTDGWPDRQFGLRAKTLVSLFRSSSEVTAISNACLCAGKASIGTR